MKTTTDSLIENCDAKIASLQSLKNLFTANRELFDQFGSGSVGCNNDNMVFLHDPPPVEKVKDLCRNIGGNWSREHGNDGTYNYYKRSQIYWTIFGAERRELPTALNLEKEAA